MPRTSVNQSDRKHTWIEQIADSQVSEDVMNSTLNTPVRTARADRLLNKWAVERETSLGHHDDLPQDEGGDVPAAGARGKATSGMARV